MSQKSQKQAQEKIFLERYQKLNTEQKDAVDTIDGPVMVVAGPGSGKTELLSLRTANILLNAQVNPQNILLLTFTDSGAQNMRERLVSIIGDAGYRVGVYTFHSFTSDVMSRYREYFFDGANYRPSTEIEKLNIIENILNELDRRNQLSSKHFEKGFTYTRDVISCIAGLKKGNISPEEFRNIINSNKNIYEEINKRLSPIFAEISGKRKLEIILPGYTKIFGELKDVNLNTQADIIKYFLSTLEFEINKSSETGDYKNLNSWRDEYFTNSTDKEEGKILKDSKDEKVQKWLALCDVYEKYNNEMHKQGLYDFEDMIFKVARELKRNSSLRNELEERYQYIMIDEFQDTNESQLSLVKSLTSSPINENSPNVCVVGDDDQAIYKFQGAELDNIHKFRSMYKNVKFITLIKNYRSTQTILDRSRNVIVNITDRLETRYPKEINKNIISSNEKLNNQIRDKEKGGEKIGIIEKTFDNIHTELDFVANEIKNLVEKGVEPSEISVISRSHANLRMLSQVMNQYKLPYSYEKREHVLDKQPIRELINITRFVASGMNNLKEELLPEILSYKFWKLERIDIWNIAEEVRGGEVVTGELGEKQYIKGSWMSSMLKSKNEKIKNIGEFLVELIADAKDEPLEILLDKIIGTREWQIDGENSDIDSENFDIENIKNKNKFLSPFREYYFGQDNFNHNAPQYLEFIFALRTFIGALREYKQGEILRAGEIEEFVNIYQNNDNLSLNLISPFATSENAVTLQTAHKSKGLEYEYVFIINSDEDEWNGRGYGNKIGLPIEMKLLSEADNLDDRIRLYYVAMTRSKHTLYITNHKNKFGVVLNGDEQIEENNITKSIIDNLYITKNKEYVENEKVLLKRLLENYKMPATHFTNFLNIGKVGPERFVEQNLLRFPQAMSPSSVYGSAMHEAMQNYYLYYKKYEKLPELDTVYGYFENALNRVAMSPVDYNKYLQSGKDYLQNYLEDLKNRGVDIKTQVEVNFANEGVYIDGVHATGKIDKMEISGDIIKVTDLKTGKSFTDWEDGTSAHDKIKLHFFTYQLAYYALLIKNSRSYSNYNIEYGYIEFLESDKKTGDINILELKITKDLLDRVSKLANIVYKKVMNLDFPDTTKWIIDSEGKEKEIKLKDILEFEEELLQENI